MWTSSSRSLPKNRRIVAWVLLIPNTMRRFPQHALHEPTVLGCPTVWYDVKFELQNFRTDEDLKRGIVHLKVALLRRKR